MDSMTESERHLAQPDKDGDIEAWYMDNSSEDQRLPHRQEPNKPCSMRTLSELGVLYWKLDADNYEHDDRLAAICKVRNYSHKEIITMSKDALPGYDEKMKMFYREHIHEDEEIRYILDGMGYFDVRDLQDRWIRIQCCKGDLIVLPEGIYHRFTLDNRDYAKLMRLFQGEPVWTPQNRPQEDNASRQKYLRGVGDGQTAAAV